jgi:peptide-methionine (S)-S-oxide reductase
MHLATLGGGCFWCLEAVFEQVRGVKSVTSGYSGGHVKSPSYRQVCGGRTGHAEVVQIEFDPSEVTFRELLDVFFTIHDPTTKDRQGSDAGPQYRSAIFTHDESQESTARQVIAELEAEKVWPAPIVTEVTPFTEFWAAEREHHQYYTRNPQQAYCRIVIEPKVARLRQKHLEKLRA